MTLLGTNTKDTYNGDGATTVFPVTFEFHNNADLRVILRDALGAETVWVEGTQYTLTGGNGATGTLTVKTTPTDFTPATGETLTIKDNQPETQGDAFPLSGSFPSTVVEQRLDKLTRMVQIHSEEIVRSILLPETASLSGLIIPEPGAAELLRYNAGGTNLETVKLGDLSTAINTILTGLATNDFLRWDGGQSAWVNITPGATGLAIFQDATAADARTELGLGTAAVVNTGVASGNVPAMDATGYPAADGSQLTNVDLPRGFIDGLIISNGTDAAHDIDIAAGVARDGGDAANMALSATLVKKLDAKFAAGTNAGGNGEPQLDGVQTVTFNDNGGADDDVTIDAGTWTVTPSVGDTIIVAIGVNAGSHQVTAATSTVINVATGSFTAAAASTTAINHIKINTWYHCWLIRRSDTGVIDFIFALSATAPTLPASYDQKRRIGAVLTDGSANIIAFHQHGNVFRWKARVRDLNITNPSTSGVLLACTVPTGINVIIHARAITDATSTLRYVRFTSPDEDNVVPDATNCDIFSSLDLQSVWFEVKTDTSAQIRYRAAISTFWATFIVITHGWEDPRGRNA